MPADNEQDVRPDSRNESRPSDGDIALRKQRRTQLRRQITSACNQIDNLIAVQGSRGAMRGIMEHLQQVQRESGSVHTDLMTMERVVEENDKQEAIQLGYMRQYGETMDKAEQYLESRRGEAASGFQGAPGGDETSMAAQRRAEEQAAAQRRAEEYAAAQRRAEEAREQVAEAERALSALSIHDDDHHSSVSHHHSIHTPSIRGQPPLAPGGIAGGRIPFNRPSLNMVAPDDWIDQYSRGTLPPAIHSTGSRSSISADLDVYQGQSLGWFSWIDVYRALVHDTPKSAGEKLALLKRYLRGDCLDIIYGLGGGEPAYIEALVRLKQSCGRRDVMRAAHIQAIDKLELKQDPASFKRFAERIRTHLFDLTRIGETSTADIIERICQRLSLHDRLAWNEGKWGQIEHRSLNDFGSWICHRASAYQNAYTLAADQMSTEEQSSKLNRRSRTHQASTDVGGTKSKPFCFKCEKEHRLNECNEFKELSTGERVTFCIRHHLCFCCFSSRHSVINCPVKEPCKHEDCRYSHHELLHDTNQLPIRKAKPSSVRSSRQGVDLGMMRLEVTSPDGRSTVRANVFVDEGSDSTLMSHSCASALKLQGHPQILEVDGVGGAIRRHASKSVQIMLRSESGEQFKIEASTMEKVANPVPVVDWSKKKVFWPHLMDLPVGEVGGIVDLLIGMDYAHLLAVQESRGGIAGEPIASRNRLGWIIRGVTNIQDSRSSSQSYRILSNSLLIDHKEELSGLIGEKEFGTELQSGSFISVQKSATETEDEANPPQPILEHFLIPDAEEKVPVCLAKEVSVSNRIDLPVDLPWISTREELRSARMSHATEAVRMDRSSGNKNCMLFSARLQLW